MSRLFETIKYHNGILHNIGYHNARLNKSRKIVFGCTDIIDLRDAIQTPNFLDNKVYKCRVIYSQKIEQVEFVPYTIKPVTTLKLVECDTIEYNHKWVDRKCFDDILKGIDADDILIVKNGFITDTSYSNIIFHDGIKWITPSTPLLRGTKREKLLKEKAISESDIKKKDLKFFSKAVLINAMMDLEESPVIDIKNIY
jgi:4-amino-4-deoxychorismate lyase